MKNQIFLSFLSFFFFLNANAQDEHHRVNHEKGPIFEINLLVTLFEEFKQNSSLGYTFGPTISLTTSKWHNRIGYEMHSNSFYSLNSYSFAKGYGSYILFQKRIIGEDNHKEQEYHQQLLGLGIEKELLSLGKFKAIFFLEFGTDFDKLIPSIGIIWGANIWQH